MNVRDLIPWGRRSENMPSLYRERDPFLSLHREMNRLFDDAFRNFGSPSMFGEGAGWPSIEVGENDREIRVTADLPGMDEKDLDVTLSNGVLCIRGEKKSETDDKERHFSERYYGRFERRIPVGPEVDENRIDASFRNGVLHVTIPKSEQAQQNVKRIPVNGSEAGARH